MASLAPVAAQACRCLNPSPALAARNASSIVAARVTAIRSEGRAVRVLVLDVGEHWKAPMSGVSEVVSAGMCGFEPTVGENYLMYLRPYAERMQTSRCVGNQPLESAAARAQIKRLRARAQRSH